MCTSRVTIIIFALTCGSVWTTPTHNIRQITNHAGLYYEPLHEVHFTRTEWRLTTYIDLRRFEEQEPTFSEMDLMEHGCKLYMQDRCKIFLDKDSLKSKHTLIKKYLTYIRKQQGIERIAKRSAPFGFIGTISKTLFGTLNTDDAAYFNHHINQLHQSEKKMAIIVRDQTHIVRSELHDMTNRLDELEKRHRENWKNVSKAWEKAISPIIHIQNLIQWKNSMDNIADTYLSSLRAIVDAIHFIKIGLLHPELLNPTTIELIVKSFVESHQQYLFPISLDEIHSGALLKISRLATAYHDKKIIIVMHIPLLEPTKFIIYKLHPLPIPQVIGNNTQGAAYVQPRASHIIISRDMDKYALVQENDFPRCQHLEKYEICSPNYPIFETTAHLNCELILLTDGGQESYRDCEIKIIKKQTPYWKQLDSMSGWLFSVPQPERVQILCDNETAIATEVNGTGILNLRPGCIAKTYYATFTGTQTLENTVKEVYIAETHLDVNQLIPNLTNYKPLVDPRNHDFAATIATQSTKGTLQFDTSLREIEEKLLTAAIQEEDQQKQTAYTTTTIYGEIILAIILLTYMLRGHLVYIACLFLNMCCHTPSTDEDKDDPSYVGVEQPQPSPRPEKVYDVPVATPRPVFYHDVSTQAEPSKPTP